MLTTIVSYFEKNLRAQTSVDTENTGHKIQLASAALMIELCMADQTIDEAETEALLAILRNKFAMDDETLAELMTLAQQEAKEATSLYQFTSLINEEYEYAEKVQLIRNMWEVAFADGHLDRYEDHLIKKVADLLYVSHRDIIKSKLAVKATLDSTL
ncbi:TerB family tellurite resistance protein [Gammaproteobacteria bacterium]|nr:TerB family tellurite resistance protein [Gammaproteobacteria bacterium]